MLVSVALPTFAAKKKLIEYGWDVPDTAFMRAHIEEMEKVPFDGVVFKMYPPAGSKNMREFGWRVFSKERFDFKDMEQSLADIKATKFKRFTDNFVQLVAYPGQIDWFDPEWSSVAYNSGMLAKFAKVSGCKGVMFDPETYGTPIWTYNNFSAEWKAAHTFEEYQKKIRERGREFMEAINREYPDITILCLYGPTAGVTLWPSDKPEDHFFGLLRWFYQGMLDVAGPGVVIVDGWEASYGYRTRDQFVQARKTMLGDTAKHYDDPAKFAKHVRCGFGIWTDYDWRGFGWDYKDFTKNYHSPAGYRASVNYGLEVCDEYVWIYSEELRWWNPARAPQPYVDALAFAKKGPGPGEPHPAQAPTVRAAAQQGYSDEQTFAEMRKTMTEVLDLPKDGWKFARDADKKGIVNGWISPGFDDSGWKDIKIGIFWEEQGEPYDGCAFYRGKFTAPAIDPNKRVYLAFGAADETAMVWLNGHYVGKHDVGPGGWLEAFCLDVTGVLAPGAENKLAVRVCDTMGAGGLWKSIKVMAK